MTDREDMKKHRRPALGDTTPKHLHKGFVPSVPPRKPRAPADMSNQELRDEVLRAGYRMVPVNHLTEVEELSNRFDAHAADVRHSFEILAGQVLPLLNEIRDRQNEHSDSIAKHDGKLGEHAAKLLNHGETLAKHETKHVEHDGHITGVFKRLTVLEMAVINVPKPKPKRRKTRK